MLNILAFDVLILLKKENVKIELLKENIEYSFSFHGMPLLTRRDLIFLGSVGQRSRLQGPVE